MDDIKLGLERILNLSKACNNPQDKCKCIHIAGTNGKGSVGAFLESILIKNGKKVGRYISPAVFDSMEIIQVNKTPIKQEEYDRNMSYLKGIEKEASVFELETALAFKYFYDMQCDICIIETGLGGRLDATNIISHPLCEILTSISMDHMSFLGNTLSEIAYEKCGIIKQNSKVITFNQDRQIMNVISKKANDMNATLYIADKEKITDIDIKFGDTTFVYEGDVYSFSLMGRHQIENALLAIKASKCLDIPTKDIKEGIKATVWKGRLDKISDNPMIIVDGAHNEKAAANLLDAMDLYFDNKKIIYVCGVLKDKEYEKMLKIMSKKSDTIITFRPNNDRGLNSENLAKTAKKFYDNVYDAHAIDKALEKVYDYSNSKDSNIDFVFVVFGSLSFMKDINRYIHSH